MKLVKQKKFGSLVMDFYLDDNEDIFVTREQIGTALGYSEPNIAISKIHNRHEDRFIGKTVLTKLVSTDGKAYETTLYSARGITEICRWARTEKSDDFFDWVTDTIEEIRVNGVYVSEDATQEQKSFNIDIFMSGLDTHNITLLYEYIEQFLSYHRKNKTRLPYERTNVKRHGNKKKEHIESMEDIRDQLVSYLNVKIDTYNNSNQAGLAQEYVRIKGMVEWRVENMRYRSAACK